MKQAMIWTNKSDPGRTNFSRKMSLSAFGAARRRLADKLISRDVEMQLGVSGRQDVEMKLGGVR